MNAQTSQTFTITPASGYQVAAVTVDGASAAGVTSYTFSNVTATYTIIASFSATNYTLTIRITGTGRGSVTTNPSGSSFRAGTTVTLTATTGRQRKWLSHIVLIPYPITCRRGKKFVPF